MPEATDTITIIVSEPTGGPGRKSDEDPCWVFDEPYLVARQRERCPVWGDEVPFKSVTVIVDADDEGDAEYSLGYVHGGDCVSRRKELKDGRVALRSDYQCW